MGKIAKLGIGKTAKLLEEQGFHVSTTDGAIAELAKEGYDPSYGARPLRRLIQTAIENQVALLLIAKEFVPGDTIMIDYDATKAAFTFGKGAGVKPEQAKGLPEAHEEVIAASSDAPQASATNAS